MSGEPEEVVDLPSEIQHDLIPGGEQVFPTATYRDWDIYSTRVITCAIANSPFPGARYATRDDALAATRLLHGKVLEANYVPGRAFFRVFKRDLP